MLDPFVPVYFGKNKKGMQAELELSLRRRTLARFLWLAGRYPAVITHYLLETAGLHKQNSNRLLEPWAWADVVISGTEWKNFFILRTSPEAQPEFKEVAVKMKALYDENKPNERDPFGPEEQRWHLPYVQDAEWFMLPVEKLKAISAARCARVSYYMQNGVTSTLDKDLKLCDRLKTDHHVSPFEHVAEAAEHANREGNFIGWKQWRKYFDNESNGDYL